MTSHRRHPTPPACRGLRSRAGWVFLLVTAVAAGAEPRVAFAQEKKEQGKAAGVFDDDDKKPGEAAKPAGTPKAGAVTDRDSIGFTQENVSSQMTELEERMFRLSEALASLEPENASRLRLALKFSREELILQQMKESQKLLREAQLSKAETEVRELLAKLEHLRRLLLAEDLDFQMKLARLRQMRETLSQLERIIKEERRELAWSRTAVDQQAELGALRERRTGLEAIIHDQKKVFLDTESAKQSDNEATRKEAGDANRGRELDIRERTGKLALDPLFVTLQPPYLKPAVLRLGDAATYLGRTDLGAAFGEEMEALDLLQKEGDRLKDRLGATGRGVATAEFQRFERDQARNRSAADTLAQVSARLGNTGIALQKDLIRAGGSMQAAEGELARTAAKPAADDQLEALKHLVKSRADLAQAVEKLLTELRAELQARIVGELTEMHEIQKEIRETTEAQAPRVAQKSRTAEIVVVGLSQKEAELGDRTEHLTALTVETEFGIALPTALRVLGREMRKIEEWLRAADASARTVTLEKRVEEDLLGLLEAMRRLPPTTAPPPGAPLPTEPGARERELNRLIAELKMIRLLQTRLNDDTTTVDGSRPKTPVLTPALRLEIESLKSSQEEIRDSLAKIASQLEPREAAPGFAPDPGLIDR